MTTPFRCGLCGVEVRGTHACVRLSPQAPPVIPTSRSMVITPGELEALRDLEAAARAWLADFDNRYDGEGLPNLQEITALKNALAALDRARR